MTTVNTIEAAIARSISHTEIVRVVVPDQYDAYESIRSILNSSYEEPGTVEVGYCILTDGSYDVWGNTSGFEEFRLRLVKAE